MSRGGGEEEERSVDEDKRGKKKSESSSKSQRVQTGKKVRCAGRKSRPLLIPFDP